MSKVTMRRPDARAMAQLLAEQTQTAAIRQQLLDLGFPEAVLNDLTPEDIAALCRELLENDEERLIMRQSLLAMKQIPAAQAICDRLEG